MGFADEVKGFLSGADSRMTKVISKIRIGASDGVIDTTPYDTMIPEQGGTAKANWNASIGSPDTSVSSAKDKTGEETKAKARQVAGSEIDKPFYLSNSLPYISVLEFGGYPNPPKDGTYLTAHQSKDGKSGPGHHVFSQNGFSQKATQGMVRVTAADFDNIVADALKETD